jgi:hypothetical protein
MENKIHLTPNGPKPCGARKRACKYGACYDNLEAAQKAVTNNKIKELQAKIDKKGDTVTMSKTDNVYKYPRTFHLPQSETITPDDKRAGPETIAYLSSGIDLIVTEKMDGGNITMMRDYFYSRSIDSGTHLWDTPSKVVHARIAHDIPDKWRISGESVYARRSVSYDNLPGPFIMFGIWDETNTLLPWDEMNEWAELFELPVVPVLYRGNDFNEATKAWGKVRNSDTSEGYVVRDSGSIAYDDFSLKAAKYVRFNHVRTDAGWRGRDDFELNTFV